MANHYEKNECLVQIEVMKVSQGLEVYEEYRVTIETDQGQIFYRNIGPSRLIDLLKIHIFNRPTTISTQNEATVHNLPS